MESGLKDLIDISRFYGVNKEYVIAGGGNTSFKNKDKLWIKASGVALAGINENGFVCLSREKLKIISAKTYSNHSAVREDQVKNDLFNAIIEKTDKRPSVETSLHELVNYAFVAHTHPTLVNAVTCSKQARKYAFELFGNDMLYVPYTDPGYVLFKKVSDELAGFRNAKGFDPKIILLENHGIIVSADNVTEIKETYGEIEADILNRVNHNLPAPEIKTENLSFNFFSGINLIIKSAKSLLIDEFVKDKAAFADIETAFTPDHIVYCKSRYLFVDDEEELKREKLEGFEGKYGFYPKIIGVKGKGLIIADDSESSINIILELITNMMKISFYARSFGGSKPMTDKQIAFIENWEAENYRKQIATKK